MSFVLPIFDGVTFYGWASSILNGGSMVRHSQYPPRLKYWIPVHYNTIAGDGQNKKSHLLFSFLVRIVLGQIQNLCFCNGRNLGDIFSCPEFPVVR